MVGIKWAAGLINSCRTGQLLHLPWIPPYSNRAKASLYPDCKSRNSNSRVMNRLNWIAYLVWGFQVARLFFWDCSCCFCLYQCRQVSQMPCLDYVIFWCLHYIFIIWLMLAHLLGTVNRKNLCQMVLSCQPIKRWTMTIVFFLFIRLSLLARINIHWSGWSNHLTILFWFTAIGSINNKTHQTVDF